MGATSFRLYVRSRVVHIIMVHGVLQAQNR